MDKKLTIQAIHNDIDELRLAVKRLKNTNDIIIYSNLLCQFNIGSHYFTSCEFDSILYSELNNTIIMLLRNSKANRQALKNLLDGKGINYNEITFEPITEEDEPEIELPTPDVSFISTESALEGILLDIIHEKKKQEATYNPLVSGTLSLGYITILNQIKNMLTVPLRGSISLDGKIALIIEQDDKPSISEETVLDAFDKYEFGYELSFKDPLHPTEKPIEKNGLVLEPVKQEMKGDHYDRS